LPAEVSSSRAERATGFTLIEMLVVLVILGRTVALIVSRGPARSPGFDLRATAGDIAQQLRLARSEAIMTDRTTSFTLDPADRRYETNGVAGPLLPPELALAMTTVTGGKPRPVPAITFAPDGSSSGGQVVLVAGANAMQVVVDWLTGRVSVAHAA
jgi:general secretion pathway protein H